MTTLQILLVVVLYLLAGQIHSLVYVLIWKPTGEQTNLGLMGLFFPLLLVLEIVLGIASQFGRGVRLIQGRFN